MVAYSIGTGCPAVKYASDVSAAVRVDPVARPFAFTSRNSVVYWALVRGSGGPDV
jgi:hypothetical protein